jgi:hypothetical protein
MFSRPSLAGSLFRIPNFCDPDVVNEKLLAANRYNELVDFFFGKKLHSQALALLKQFGTADKPNDVAPALHGPQRTVLYLQNLPPSEVDLILQYAEWTLRADPELGMEVFIADTENAETLPRDRVVKFLEGIDTTLEIQYLEHIIVELNDMTPDFHNRLAELFTQYLKQAKRGEKWDRDMDRFVRFLKDSRQYSLGKAFGMIPRDGKTSRGTFQPKLTSDRPVLLRSTGGRVESDGKSQASIGNIRVQNEGLFQSRGVGGLSLVRDKSNMSQVLQPCSQDPRYTGFFPHTVKTAVER